MDLITILEIAAGVIFIISMVVITICLRGEEKKKAYNKDFLALFNRLSYEPATQSNFYILSRGFRHLNMNNQDPERTEVLWSIFTTKYEKFFLKNNIHIEKRELKLN